MRRHDSFRARMRCCCANLLAYAGLLLLPTRAQAALYWDADASPVGNNTVSGAGLGGSGTWGSATNWFNGSGEVPWAAGADAVFSGTAGGVSVASPQSAASLSFKTDGYTLTGSTLSMGPTPAIYQVDAGVTATIASTIAGGATMTKTGPGTLVLSNTANTNTATTTEGGWRIDGGTLRIAGDGSLGAPLPDVARNTVTDIQLNQSTLQFGASFDVDQNRRTKVNTNSTSNLGDAVIDVNSHVVRWFGSIQGGMGSLRVTSGNNGGMLVLGTDKKASVNPFGSGLPGGTVNLTVENGVVVQTSGQVTPDGGELGSEINTATGEVLAVKLQGGGQIRSESGGYTFQRNLILGPGGGSLDTGAWLQTWLGAVSGPGSLGKWGGSKLVLDNAIATWTGGTHIHQGTLELGRGGSNGLLPGTLANPSPVIIDAGATLRFNRGSNKSFFDSISGGGELVVANANNAVVRLVSSNTYTGLTTIASGRLMIGQGNPGEPGSIVSDVLNNAELIFNRVEDITYGGSISGTGVVTKMGAGKLTLTGASSYSGQTNVSAGALLANNSVGSATGSGPVGVASGATIGGFGAIGGAVTLNAGAHLAPGNGVGTLNVGGLVLTADCLLDFELGSPAASDLINVTTVAGLALDGGTINITPASGFGIGQYPLLDYTGSFTGSSANLALGSAPAGFVYSVVNNPATTSIDVVVAVPEPAGLFLLSALVPLRRRRRRAREDRILGARSC